MRVYFAVALGLVAGLALASWQKVAVQAKSTPLPDKLTAVKLSGKSIAAVDGAFGNKGDITSKDYMSPGPGLKKVAVYWEKGKVWSVTYELEPKKELSVKWWEDALRTAGFDPAKGKLSQEKSDDETKVYEDYPDLKGTIMVDYTEDEKAGDKIVSVDWETEPEDE